jgi:integrase
MASLYPRGKIFWIKYRDGNGNTIQVSTGCRIDVQPDIRKARAIRAQREAEELMYAPTVNAGWAWVTDYINVRYATAGVTRERYLTAWATIELYLKEFKIEHPRHLTRDHCFKYMTWRAQPDKSIGKYKAGHNTALLELKVLRIMMNEAVVRHCCTGNPCVRLDIKRAPRKKKPELTDAHYALIESKIPDYQCAPAAKIMLKRSLAIARHQGCRVNETRLNPFTDVDFEKSTITFRAKGREEDFITALNPKLRPFFKKLRAEKCKETWTPPEDAARTWASSNWTKFLDRTGLRELLPKNACFHSCRVSAASRMAREGVPRAHAQAMLGHASEVVADSYVRVELEDLKACVQAIG